MTAAEIPADQPVRLVSIQQCADFDAFMAVMSEDTPTLADRGILGRSIYRAVDDPNEVMVTIYFRTREEAEKFMLKGEDLQKWLERAKVSIYPAVFVGMQVERVVCEQPASRELTGQPRDRSAG
jgi:hypothetical protein